MPSGHPSLGLSRVLLLRTASAYPLPRELFYLLLHTCAKFTPPPPFHSPSLTAVVAYPPRLIWNFAVSSSMTQRNKSLRFMLNVVTSAHIIYITKHQALRQPYMSVSTSKIYPRSPPPSPSPSSRTSPELFKVLVVLFAVPCLPLVVLFQILGTLLTPYDPQYHQSVTSYTTALRLNKLEPTAKHKTQKVCCSIWL